MQATASRTISYTFGPGQKEGTDNVSVTLTIDAENPLTGAVERVSTQATVSLPSSGWTDDDVLKALQVMFPKFDVQWESPPADLSSLPE
ncbi:MAG: hypothetical protein WC700_02110 [Gemmatimonadaceae bacterium]|jgi:hypothetical protein